MREATSLRLDRHLYGASHYNRSARFGRMPTRSFSGMKDGLRFDYTHSDFGTGNFIGI